ncbi:calcineurin subunit B-like [Drosophila tropicalis]|uniref:calcineurin subunit B-like n=1 Tax=Drosophila tropicalis TaxID=46794 RepID=UPI0035ABFF70
MGTAVSRPLSAEELALLQKETGFSLHRIDSLYDEYHSMARDSKDRVLRSELLQMPAVAAHPLSERLVDSFLHPSHGFRHFIMGLAHFRGNQTLERKLANMVSMFDEDGDGQLSVEQCHNLLECLPATRRELRVMRWKLNKLLDEKVAEKQQQQDKLTLTPTTIAWDRFAVKVNCADFEYITRGLDLEHSLSLRFN